MKEKSKRDPWYIIALRYVIGGVFLSSGIKAFLPESPIDFMPASATEILGGTDNYLYVTVKVTEVLVGLSFITNILVPLFLVILSPILVNIVLYSIFENPSNIVMSAILLSGSILLAGYYKRFFKAFIKPQLYTQGWREETANILILEEVEEKIPLKADEVRKIITELENVDRAAAP